MLQNKGVALHADDQQSEYNVMGVQFPVDKNYKGNQRKTSLAQGSVHSPETKQYMFTAYCYHNVLALRLYMYESLMFTSKQGLRNFGIQT